MSQERWFLQNNRTRRASTAIRRTPLIPNGGIECGKGGADPTGAT
jgi:hypothetical protein